MAFAAPRAEALRMESSALGPFGLHQAFRTQYTAAEAVFECLMPGCPYRAVRENTDGATPVLITGHQTPEPG